MTLAPGSRLGPYEVVAALGAGAMGEVYRARDTRLDRTPAIKVLPEQFFENRESIGRFEREAKPLAAVCPSRGRLTAAARSDVRIYVRLATLSKKSAAAELGLSLIRLDTGPPRPKLRGGPSRTSDAPAGQK